MSKKALAVTLSFLSTLSCFAVSISTAQDKRLKTPGVYIEEKNAFPNSVVEVATAVPAFVGYTEKAIIKQKTLRNKPVRISSLAEYEQYFGGAPPTRYTFIAGDNQSFNLELASGNYNLYYGMRFFYANGGGPCYIVSVGDYSDTVSTKAILGNPDGGLSSLLNEQEPTMLVVPDAVLLDIDGWQEVCQQMLAQCGELQNRVAILDVYDGYRPRDHDADNDVISGEVAGFRKRIASDFLSFGVSYYPWLNTSVVSDANFTNIANPGDMVPSLSAEADQLYPPAKSAKIKQLIGKLNDGLTGNDAATLHQELSNITPLYKKIVAELKTQMNLLPPSAGIAGVYTLVDNTRGVFKSPANVSMNSVLSPAVNITHEDQEDLNVPLDGKAINAIRTFPGQGILIWGARTLNGNNSDWRYINVRRTMIMLEQSIKLALASYAFEPNTSATWTTVRSMISNFLTNQWKQGALAGATPDDAFFVNVGLGSTMTQNDIDNGEMKVSVGVAIIRPAEFIITNFVQKMQAN
jgi:hypothetical protein